MSKSSIGAPVYNTQYHILDEHRRPVAEGEIGELYVGGVQLARGYLHRPDLTADRFIRHPLREGSPDGRLYKTGDLAFWNPDGTVQFAGRTDNQVKLRGFRVELDEIKLAIENVAVRLGNTVAVCRKCYVHPAVVEAYLDGSLADVVELARNGAPLANSTRLSTAELAVLKLLRERAASAAGKRSA